MAISSEPSGPSDASVTGSPNTRSFSFPKFTGMKAVVARLRPPTVHDLRQQNVAQPVSQLPEDLVCKVFAHVIDMTSPVGEKSTEAEVSERKGAPWSWVQLTHVCHQWRTAALNAPLLWRHIDFSHPKWHYATLEKAKMQPLLIRAAVERNNIRLVRRTLQLAHQIESIEINSALHHIHDLLPTLAHPNPTLQSMTVRVDTAGHGVGQGNIYEPPSFPVTGPILSEMQSLELHSTPFYLVSGRYTSLTNLHLSNLTPCERPTLQHFLFALSKYPHLQHLTLDNAFPLSSNSVPFPQASPKGSIYPPSSALPSASSIRSKPSSPPPGASSRVSRLRMAHLETLCLIGTLTDMTTILESLMIPPTVEVSCKIISLSDWQQSMPKLGQALRNHANANSNVGYTAETLVMSGVTRDVPSSLFAAMARGQAPPSAIHGARIRIVNTFMPPVRMQILEKGRRSPSPPPTSQHLWMDITIGPDTSGASLSSELFTVRSLCSLWSFLPLSRIHTLAIRNLDIITQKTWTQFLKDLTALRRLDVTGNAPSGIIWALLLNADACIQREASEREKRQRKAELKLKATSLNNPDSLLPTPPLSPIPPTARKVFVPLLTDIYLNKMDCSSGGYMMSADAAVNSYWDLDDSRFLDVLLACLQQRSIAQNCRSQPSPSLEFPPNTRPMKMSKLRSLSISNCTHVSKCTVLAMKDLVSYLAWDQKGLIKDENDPEGKLKVARYRRVGDGSSAASVPASGSHPGRGNGKNEVKHYYRLEALLDG